VVFPERFAGGLIYACQVGATFSRFGRHLLNIPYHLLTEFEQTVLMHSQMAKQYAEMNFWPMNFTACDKYFGCEYAPLCKVAEVDRRFFMSDYEHFEWDLSVWLHRHRAAYHLACWCLVPDF